MQNIKKSRYGENTCFFAMVVFIPMIFNGGMISSYFVNTQLLNLKNSTRKSVSKCAEAAARR